MLLHKMYECHQHSINHMNTNDECRAFLLKVSIQVNSFTLKRLKYIEMTLLQYGRANSFIRILIVLKRDADIRRTISLRGCITIRLFLPLMHIHPLWKNNYFGKYNNA